MPLKINSGSVPPGTECWARAQMPGKHQKEWTREKGDSIIEENPVPVTGGEGGYYEEGVRDTLHKTGARRSAQCIGGETAGDQGAKTPCHRDGRRVECCRQGQCHLQYDPTDGSQIFQGLQYGQDNGR